MKIKDLEATKIFNSKGDYSLEISITTEDGTVSASVPRGTSVGKYEKKPFSGGIDSAINRINKVVKNKLLSRRIRAIGDILKFEDYTTIFGGHVTLGVSYALLKALALEKSIPVYQLFTEEKKIPFLLNKMIGGGVHAQGDTPEFQEFLVLDTIKNPEKVIRSNLKVRKDIADSSEAKGSDFEGGLVLDISNDDALSLLKKHSGDKKIGLDIAASTFFKNGRYIYSDGRELTREQQIDYIVKLANKYKLFYIEDPLEEDDFEGFSELREKLKEVLIVGDDLFATDPERLKKGTSLNSCNGCIVKPDQIGSLKKTIDFVKLAKKNRITTIISHRSGETNEDILTDLAIGLQIPVMKMGIHGGERLAKLNRLIKIWRE
jgi:enolase